MRAQSRGSLGNILIKKVRRHATVATLFRSPVARGAPFSQAGLIQAYRSHPELLPETPAGPPFEPAGEITTLTQAVTATASPGTGAKPLEPGGTTAGRGIYAEPITAQPAAAPPAIPQPARPAAPVRAMPVQTSNAAADVPSGQSSLPQTPGSSAPKPGSAALGPAASTLPSRTEPRSPSGTPIQRSPSPSQPAPAGTLPAKEAAQTPASAPSSEQQTEMDDTTWRRLQRIFKKHEQKQAEEDSSAKTASSQPAPGGAFVQRQSLPVSNTGAIEQKPAPEQETKPIRRSPETLDRSSTGEESSAQAGIAPESAPAAPASRAPGASAERTEQEIGAPTLPNPPTPIATRQQPAPGERGGQATEGFENDSIQIADRPVDPAQNRLAVPEADYLDEIPVLKTGQTAPEENTEPEPVMQSLPLEAVWPIQRMDNPEADAAYQNATVGIQPPAVSPAGPAPGRSPDALPSEALPSEQEGLISRPEDKLEARSVSTEAQQAHHVLENISPGQPTDSSLEYIAPRRPRPGAGNAGISHQASPSRPVPLPVQRSGEESPNIEQASASYLVETDIGPLPSDLWQLIGQAPPGAPKTQPEASLSPSSMAEDHAAYMPMVGPAASPARLHSPAEPAGTSSALTLSTAAVQRQVAVPVVSDVGQPTSGEPASDQPQAGAPASEKGATSEMDMDELARRVHSEVRRRLSVEWERIRKHL